MNRYVTSLILTCLFGTGKGDLVGCDISMHLVANSNGQGGNSQHNNNSGQDVVVKSSSDVKVSAKYTINHTLKIPL